LPSDINVNVDPDSPHANIVQAVIICYKNNFDYRDFRSHFSAFSQRPQPSNYAIAPLIQYDCGCIVIQ